MKPLFLSLATAAALAAPAISFAATYQYVDMQGYVRSQNATNPTDALTSLSTISPRSGVILVADPSQAIPEGMYVGN